MYGYILLVPINQRVFNKPSKESNYVYISDPGQRDCSNLIKAKWA